MTEQAAFAYDLPLDKDEVNKVFESYDFRDAIGNPLTLCIDFMVLVNAYAASNEGGRNNPNAGRGMIFELDRKPGPPYPYQKIK